MASQSTQQIEPCTESEDCSSYYSPEYSSEYESDDNSDTESNSSDPLPYIPSIEPLTFLFSTKQIEEICSKYSPTKLYVASFTNLICHLDVNGNEETTSHISTIVLMNEFELKLDGLLHQRSEDNERIGRFKEEIKFLNYEIRDWEERNRRLRQDNTTMQTKYNPIRNENVQLKAKIEYARHLMQTNKENEKNQSYNLIALKEKFEKLQANHKELIENLSLAGKDLIEAFSQKNELEKTLDIAKNKYKTKQVENSKLKQQQEQLQIKCNELETKYQFLQKQTAKQLENEQSQRQELKNAYDKEIKTIIRIKADNNAFKEKYYSLRAKYLKQKNDLDTANEKYEKKKAKQEKLKQEQKEMETKYDEKSMHFDNLMREYKSLQSQYNAQRDKFGYIEWTAQDIADWIVSIDKIRYYKYYDVLSKNLAMELIDGQCLYEFEKNDLHRLGIVGFKDKNDIFAAIQRLIANGKSKIDEQRIGLVYEEKEMESKYESLKRQYEEALNQKECVICWENMRTVCCIPCGHVCLCGECKGVDGECPICQTNYNCLVKIYF